MAVSFDHTCIMSKDPGASADFMAGVLGAGEPRRTGGAPEGGIPPFYVFTLGPVNLDFCYSTGEVASQHYGFLVDDDTFEAAREFLDAEGIEYADGYTTRGLSERRREVRTWADGGRGIYFFDADGHSMELTTKNEHHTFQAE